MNAVGSQQAGGSVSESQKIQAAGKNFTAPVWEFWILRLALVGASIAICYALRPFDLHALPAAGLGFFVAMIVLLAELRLRRAEFSGLMCGAAGLVLGLIASLLITLVIARTSEPEPAKSFLEFISLVSLGFLGLVIGAQAGDGPGPDGIEARPLAQSVLDLVEDLSQRRGRAARGDCFGPGDRQTGRVAAGDHRDKSRASQH